MNNYIKSHLQLFAVGIVCVGIIMKYSDTLDYYLTQNENKKYAWYFKGGQITLWSLTHFLFFLGLGYLFPKNIVFAMSGGILWEVYEFYLEYN